MSSKLQLVFIQLAAGTLRGLSSITAALRKPLRRFTTPIHTIGGFFLLLLLPCYRLLLSYKKLFKKFYAPHKSRNRFIHPFSRRYMVHGVIVAVSFFTVATNLNANEIRHEDFRTTSIVSALISPEDLGLIEDEGPITAGVRTRYLDQTNVELTPQSIEGDATTDLLPSTVAGGSAVVRPILSPAEQDLRQRDQIIAYTVQPDDTISEIADRFGVTTNTILWENDLGNYSLIRPGDSLTILPTSGIRHKVAKGDTLDSIAKKYKVDGEKIAESNKLASAQDLQIGEQLLIPGGQKPYVAPSYTVRTTWYQPPAASQEVVASGKMIWPTTCRRITQYYSWRHSGADIACKIGDAIYAADDGRVIRAQNGWNGGYGNVIIVEHGNGTQTLYGHNRQLYVEVGEQVTKGQIIAAMGSTGRSTGPHLHFEVRNGGVITNPLNYIR